jgi:hypothetical protein|eukprot:g4651.t1
MNFASKALALACLAVGTFADEADLSSRAFVLVQKSIITPEVIKHSEGELKNVLVESRNASVKITVKNVGGVAASDVQVTDSFEDDLFNVHGSTSATYKSLNAGESQSFEFVIVPTWFTEDLRNVSQYYTQNAASVAYSYGEGDDLVERVSESSTEMIVPVFSNEDYLARTALFLREWITFFLLAAGPVLGPFFYYMTVNRMIQDSQKKR